MLLAQQGWGKADRIEIGLDEGLIEGVIASPKDMTPGSLEPYLRKLSIDYPQANLYFDPQFFVAVLSQRNPSNLVDYTGYFPRPILRRRALADRAIVRNHVERTLDYQELRPVSALISPTVISDSLSGRWFQIAMTFARESISYRNTRGFRRDLLVTVMLDESCLSDLDRVENLLDELTTLDVAGFYVIIRRSDDTYQAATDRAILVNLLYLVYALGEVNEYRVICGYSDFLGLGLIAAGAEAIATGWHHGLRQFSMRRWLPPTGGQRANARYSSAQLMNSVYVLPEMEAMYDAGMIGRVISGTSRDGDYLLNRPSAVTWTEQASQLHHWEVICTLQRAIKSSGDLDARLTTLRDSVEQALDLYDEAVADGVGFSSETGRRELDTLSEALEEFEDIVP